MTASIGSTSGLGSDANGNETANRGSFDVGIAARTDTVNVRDQLTGLATTNSDNSTGTTSLSYAGSDNTTRTGIATTSSAAASTSVNLLTGPLGLQNSLDGTGATTSYTRTPNGTLVVATAPDGTSTYFGSDITGSITVETNASGTAIARYTYDPFGAVRVTGGAAIAAANPYRYGGAYGAYTGNSTGLIKMGARYYNAAQGRFTQRDPSGQEANAYLYAEWDPVNHSDPSGLDLVDDVLGTASAVTGVAGLVLDATGVGAPAGAILGATSTALGAVQFGYDCSTGGNCAEAAFGAGVGVASLGLFAGFGDGAAIGADILGTTAAVGGASAGYYCDYSSC